jgi:uncharacterized protein (DUF934 family)
MLISAISEPSAGGARAQARREDRAHRAPRVFKNHRVVEDSFTYIADDALAGSESVIVSLKRFQAEKGILLSRNTPIGVRLETSQSAELLAEDISRLSLIEIHIPYFKDGRAFSWARLLRTRLGFKGEIRVTGHFLLDQIAFFMRVGVDSFTLPENLSAADVEKAVGQISNVYQPSSDHRLTIRDLRHGTVLAAESVPAP